MVTAAEYCDDHALRFFYRDWRLPSCRSSASAASCVASLVCKLRTISTGAITGTGLKKCKPMKRAGHDTKVDSLVIEIEEAVILPALTDTPFGPPQPISAQPATRP